MERIHEGYEYKDFEMPSSIEKKTICAKTGKLASSEACSAYTEYFAPGTAPTQSCPGHVVEKPDTDANSSDTSGETDDTTDNNSGTTTPPSDNSSDSSGNILKHTQAKQIHIQLKKEDTQLVIHLHYDGDWNPHTFRQIHIHQPVSLCQHFLRPYDIAEVCIAFLRYLYSEIISCFFQWCIQME